MEQQKEWFKEWFNSPYYHILYGDRDRKEAEFFLTNLVSWFDPNPDASFLDLACGAGRHSIFLNNKGFNVTGIDLSSHSISLAKSFENERLHFEVGDLRTFSLPQKFDFVLNLFTSFGYFDCMQTNQLVLEQIKKALKPGGFLVIDFLNAERVLSELIPFEIKVKDGISFNISKVVENGIIIKDIKFSDKGNSYHYQEKVQALRLSDFHQLITEAGLTLVNIFGNYSLQTFSSIESERLILVIQHPHA